MEREREREVSFLFTSPRSTRGSVCIPPRKGKFKWVETNLVEDLPTQKMLLNPCQVSSASMVSSVSHHIQ